MTIVNPLSFVRTLKNHKFRFLQDQNNVNGITKLVESVQNLGFTYKSDFQYGK